MTSAYDVTGPMWSPTRPSVRSGLYRCGCSPCDGGSCDRCDGQAAEDAELWSASPEQRRTYLAGLSAWRAGFDASAPTVEPGRTP